MGHGGTVLSGFRITGEPGWRRTGFTTGLLRESTIHFGWRTNRFRPRTDPLPAPGAGTGPTGRAPR
ncbi:hypothetical protein IL38_00085 [Actinopolyspora erythraea]|uniref:Uncharacterized protein n=1 Tax=Actinopolyspora erythraea TaxID=414996 RepID=A0ABR4X9E3_9ACTN|nr:hypothetical protein IL38_00085 [Actinopolyspora erythraea]